MRIATLNLAVIFLTVIALSPLAEAADWLTMPSRYSHNPSTGERVTQYTKIQAPSVPQPSNFRTSGYTHTRSSLNYGQSADNYHRVEQWGDPVRPYGEWRFPYRPYSTPYPNWGPPYAGLNLGGGYYGPYGPSPYDPYRGGGLDSGGRYPTTGPRGRGNYPAANRGPAAGLEGVPGDGLLPPAATMSVVPNRDGIGMPVDGIIPEGERCCVHVIKASGGSQHLPSNGRAEGERPVRAGNPGGPNGFYWRQPSKPAVRSPGKGPSGDQRVIAVRYRPTPQPSPFNPYPSGPGTPYPVAPYYDGYYPVYRQ